MVTTKRVGRNLATGTLGSNVVRNRLRHRRDRDRARRYLDMMRNRLRHGRDRDRASCHLDMMRNCRWHGRDRDRTRRYLDMMRNCRRHRRDRDRACRHLDMMRNRRRHGRNRDRACKHRPGECQHYTTKNEVTNIDRTRVHGRLLLSKERTMQIKSTPKASCALQQK